jgi:hypothetical protein
MIMPPYSNNTHTGLLNGIGVALVHADDSGCNDGNYYGGVAVPVPVEGINLRANSRYYVGYIITKSLSGCRTAFLCRCLVLDRPNTSDPMVISMDLFSLDQARSLSF